MMNDKIVDQMVEKVKEIEKKELNNSLFLAKNSKNRKVNKNAVSLILVELEKLYNEKE